MATTFEEGKATHIHHMEDVPAGDDYATDLLTERGALILEDEQHLSVWQTTKLHWRAVMICSISFTAGLLFGYDTVVNGASISMPGFMLYFGAIGPKGPYLPSVWTSLWTAMSALLQAIGAFCVGFIMDRFGRKWPAVAAGAITMIGTSVQFTAVSRGALLAGKMVNGLGVGIALAAATSYASEIAPQKLRRPIQSALVLFTVFMQGAALGVIRSFVPNIKPEAFRTVFAIQWAVGGVVLIAFALAPESPVYLITNNRLVEAQKVMTKIYGLQNDPDARLASIIKTIREEKESKELEKGTYIECFQGKSLRRTLAVILIFTTANLGGAAFLAQAIYFLIIAGLPALHAFDVSIGGFGLACIIIVASWFVVDKARNRTAFYVGLVLNFVGMLVVGALYYSSNPGALWAIAVLMSLMISLQTSLLQGMGWPIAAELSSLRLRGKTISIGIIFQTLSTWLTQFIMPYIYNVDAGDLLSRTGFIFAGTSILLFAASWNLIPDTTGMTSEDLDHAYNQGLPAWRINKGAAESRFGFSDAGKGDVVAE